MAVPLCGKIRGQNWGGIRMELIVLDDPEDDESVVQEDQRNKRERWIKTACLNSLSRKRGSLIWYGTILHQDSLLNRQIKRAPPKQWIKFRLPAYNHTGETHGDMNPGDLLWPEGWTMEQLMDRKAEMGLSAALFSQEFLNEPMSEEDQIFKSEWWKFYDPRDVRTGAGRWEMADPFEPSVHRTLAVYGAVDPAISLEKKADYFAYCIIGRMDSPHAINPLTKKVMPLLFVLEMWRGKLPFGEQLEKIEKVHRKWDTLAFRIESQAYQIALQQATRSMGIPAEEIKHRQNKIARVTKSALPFELGQAYLPLGSKMVDTFVEEAENFPNGVTDDMCDAWCMCQERALGGHRGGIEVLDKKREMHKEISNF
jgi:predicted phage terminase large subunit-like protein